MAVYCSLFFFFLNWGMHFKSFRHFVKRIASKLCKAKSTFLKTVQVTHSPSLISLFEKGNDALRFSNKRHLVFTEANLDRGKIRNKFPLYASVINKMVNY